MHTYERSNGREPTDTKTNDSVNKVWRNKESDDDEDDNEDGENVVIRRENVVKFEKLQMDNEDEDESRMKRSIFFEKSSQTSSVQCKA